MKKFFILSIIISSVMLFGQSAFAKSTYFSLPKEVNTGDIFEVLIYLDTGGENINSIDFIIDFDVNKVEFSGYRENDTNIKIWVESPKERNGKVYLSGIIPGGIAGVYEESSKSFKDILLVKLLFKGKSAGNTNLSFEKKDVFKNDGKGSILEVSSQSKDFIISGRDLEGDLLQKDVIPPVPFEINFIKKTDDTPDLVYFSALDIGSGIEKYEVKVGSGDWEESTSPKEVKRGFFNRKVLVKAYDYERNSYLSAGRIPGIVPNYIIIIFGFLLFGFLGYRMIKYKV